MVTESTLSVSVDTAWVLLCGVLVFFMQAGFALLESGMSRSKNAVNVMMKNFADVCVATVAYWLIGFGLMFGINETGWFGASFFATSYYSDADFSFIFFQMMFAATAATIASGAMAERANFMAYLLGSVVIISIIYPVYGSWAWGGAGDTQGWLKEMGFIDFAGSTVVHSVGAWCALAGVLVLGPRLGRFDRMNNKSRIIPGHNLSMVALGGFIMWLGWFGFNLGSTLTLNDDIGLIALNTQLGAAGGGIGALLTMALLKRAILLTQTINGALAGLVSITAGCATFDPKMALLVGVLGGMISIVGAQWLENRRIDDVVGAIPVHGFAGIWGTVAAGMFIAGAPFNIQQVWVQCIGVFAAFMWTFPLAYIMYFLIDRAIELRVPSLNEQRGLDASEHYEVGYPEFSKEGSYVPDRIEKS